MTATTLPRAGPSQATVAPPVDREKAHRLLYTMLLIRNFEGKCVEMYSAAKIRGFMHLYDGEEAIATGIMDVLTPDDAIVATYREHGHAIARGISPGAVMAEMFGKQEGCARGRGGSMHMFDAAHRFYGGNAIVASAIPLAAGMGLADKLRGLNRVTVCFFGDGAVAEGEFHEALNLAALWKAPVLFVCENNEFCMGTALKFHQSEPDIAKKAAAYRIPAKSVDGMDVLAVREATREAVEAIRAGDGPQFMECRTYRFRAHSMFDAELYRDKADVRKWRARDPITTFAAYLTEHDLLTAAEQKELEAKAVATVQEAVDFAEAGTLEPVADLTRFVYSEPDTPFEGYKLPPAEPPATETHEITYREAMREAIAAAIRRDPRVFLLGADVGRYGGCFAVSKGLLDEFGPDRIVDTPLAESGYTGAGIGAAMNGTLPIVEVMTVNFSLLAADQIINNAATVLHMSGGQFNVPVVIRMATGGGKRLAAQHSHSWENYYAHVPGLKVLAPATVADARGMLEPALADPDPVLIFENSLLYNMKATIPVNAGPVDIDHAAVRREGKDISIFAYSINVFKALEAAEMLAKEGIDCEVVDLRTLRPLDDATIMASIAKTHRALIVDEGCRTLSIAGEISARIMEQAFYDLDMPVQRLCCAEVPLPYAGQLEDAAIPQPDTIAAAARRMVTNG